MPTLTFTPEFEPGRPWLVVEIDPTASAYVAWGSEGHVSVPRVRYQLAYRTRAEALKAHPTAAEPQAYEYPHEAERRAAEERRRGYRARKALDPHHCWRCGAQMPPSGEAVTTSGNYAGREYAWVSGRLELRDAECSRHVRLEGLDAIAYAREHGLTLTAPELDEHTAERRGLTPEQAERLLPRDIELRLEDGKPVQ